MDMMDERVHKVDHWRWPSFTPHEVLSPMGLKQYSLGNLMLQPYAMDLLQAFRDVLKVRIVCNSSTLQRRGYRSQAENAEAEGCLLSRHMQGIAFDITAPDLSIDELHAAAVSFGWGGVGKYLTLGFVHVDCRAILNGKPITWQQ